MQRLDRVLAVPTPHAESISSRLARNTNPWLVAEIRASTDGHQAYVKTSRNQTSNSTLAV